MARKINQRSYKYYVVVGDKIESGWDFKEDARDAQKDNGVGGKVLSKIYLKGQGIDPDDNASWMTGWPVARENRTVRQSGAHGLILGKPEQHRSGFGARGHTVERTPVFNGSGKEIGAIQRRFTKNKAIDTHTHHHASNAGVRGPDLAWLARQEGGGVSEQHRSVSELRGTRRVQAGSRVVRSTGRFDGGHGLELRNLLEKGVILVAGGGDTIELGGRHGREPVLVAVVVNVQSYGPHVGAIWAIQGGHIDTALQEAHEELENWEDEKYPENADDDHKTGTYDARTFKLLPTAFEQAIKGTKAAKFIEINKDDEGVEESRGMRERHPLTGPSPDDIYRYRGASIEVSSTGRNKFATVRFRNQEKDFDAMSTDEVLEKAKDWIDSAPELRR